MSITARCRSLPITTLIGINAAAPLLLGMLAALILFSCDDRSSPPDDNKTDRGMEAGVSDGRVAEVAVRDGRVVEAAVRDGRGEETPGSLVALRIIPRTVSLSCNQSVQLEAQGEHQDGGIEDLTEEVEWSISDPTSATIDTQGKLTALTYSTNFQVTADHGTLSAEASVTVFCDVMQSLLVTPPQAQVGLCNTPAPVNFTANALFPDGSVMDATEDAAWQSSTPSVATVLAGVATPVNVGDTEITATYLGFSHTVPLNVFSPSLVGLGVSPGQATVLVGLTMHFQAYIISSCPGEETDVTTAATWSSSAPDKATIDTSGVVTALEAGTTTIKATHLNFENTATLTIQ